MGLFAEWQPRYAAVRLAIFPVDLDTKAALVRWRSLGVRGSTRLVPRFADCLAFGFQCGARYNRRITVLDIDTTDERALRDALDKHGNAGIIARTANGKFHAYYRYAGERRRIRPWEDLGLPLDVLGAGGYVVAPPSRRRSDGASYEFIQGGLADLDQLHEMQGVDDFIRPPSKEQQPDLILPDDVMADDDAVVESSQLVRPGRRNKTLWECCMLQVKAVDTFDELLAFARAYNEDYMQPKLADMEVINTAMSAWRYEQRGENYFGGRGLIPCPRDMVEDMSKNQPDALVLMMVARAYHWDDERFCLANGMAEKLHWTLPRFKAARRYLEHAGYLLVLHRGGRGPHDPTQYGWRKGPKAR
jgi:hypothetical protein